VPIAVESDPERVSALRENGPADTVIDSSTVNVRNALLRSGGPGLAGYLDLVCSPETLRAGPWCLRPHGRLVAARPPALAAHSRTLSALLPEYSWIGEHRASRQEIALALNMVAAGLVRLWVGARFPLADVEKALPPPRPGPPSATSPSTCATPTRPRRPGTPPVPS
jgi:D-arabinose 1-dehydrogenase-like Zn-dependent alcohol dehydrogenase